MRFKDFSPAERSILLNALDNQIQWLRGQLSVPADPAIGSLLTIRCTANA